MLLKSFILYAVIAWDVALVENQVTLQLAFDSRAECESIASQAESLRKAKQAPFRFKTLQCVPCTRLYGNDCPRAGKAKVK